MMLKLTHKHLRIWWLPALLAVCMLSQRTPTASAGYWVGAQAPEIALDEMVQGPDDPSQVKLASLRGKVVVLAFWSVHCPSCPKVIPQLNKLAEAFKDQPVQIISIVNQSREEVNEFLEKLPVNTWLGIDSDLSITYDYLIMGVPMAVIVNPAGVVAAITHPLSVTEEVIRTTLAGKTPVVPMAPPAESLLDKTPPTQLAMYEMSIRAAPMAAKANFSRVGGLKFKATPLRDILYQAYGVEASLIHSSTLLLDAKYDGVIIPPKGHENESRAMLVELLERTFPLKAHKEERSVETLVLRMPDGPGPRLAKPDKAQWSFDIGKNYIVARNASMADLVYQLFPILNKTIIDDSGDANRYDFTTYWQPGDPTIASGMFDRMRDQLGVEFVPETRTMEVLIVERATNEPSEDSD